MPTLEELARQKIEGGDNKKKEPGFDREEEIGAVSKGNKQAIVIRHLIKGTQEYYDLRVFYWDKNQNSFRPTPKGVMMTLDQFREVVELVKNIHI